MHYHYLTIEQRESLTELLKQRAAMLQHEIAAALRRSGDESALGLANHLDEVGDDAVADLESAIDVAEVERDARELREVERALTRVHEPEYGVCADCGEDIPFSRLSVNPVATRCAACQTRAERVLSEPTQPA